MPLPMPYSCLTHALLLEQVRHGSKACPPKVRHHALLDLKSKVLLWVARDVCGCVAIGMLDCVAAGFSLSSGSSRLLAEA